MSVYELIRQAILNRQQVIADYHGHERHLCPHVLGSKHGREQCLFYQFGGTSSQGAPSPPGALDNWRCIPIEGLENVTIRDGEWFTAANYDPLDKCVGEVDVAL